MTGYMPSRINPKLKQLIELVQDLYKVKVSMIPSGYTNDQLVLRTDSIYSGLDEFKFNVTEKNEEADLQKHIDNLLDNVKGAVKYAKECMLQYWVNIHQKPKLVFNKQYQNLLDLLSDNRVSSEYFEEAIGRKFYYRSPVEIVRQKVLESKVIVRKFLAKGKIKKFPVKKDFGIEKTETKTVKVPHYDIQFDPIKIVQPIMEQSMPIQKSLEDEAKRLATEEKKIRQYRA